MVKFHDFQWFSLCRIPSYLNMVGYHSHRNVLLHVQGILLKQPVDFKLINREIIWMGLNWCLSLLRAEIFLLLVAPEKAERFEAWQRFDRRKVLYCWNEKGHSRGPEGGFQEPKAISEDWHPKLRDLSPTASRSWILVQITWMNLQAHLL